MIKYAVYKTKIGYLKIGYVESKVVYLQKSENDNDTLQKTEFTDFVAKQVQEYLKGKRKKFDFEIEYQEVTEFQRKVYQELLKIPYGTTATYKEIAERIGNPKASRAVGLANNRNKIAIIVPCHRVVGSNGKLVGYAGGLDMKEYLLDLERKNK